jgi:hypothetical protein
VDLGEGLGGRDFSRAVVASPWLGAKTMANESVTRNDETIDPVIAPAFDPELTDDLAIALLKRPDLEREALERIRKNRGLMKSRKVRLALVEHPKTPRHVILPLLRHLFTFDLMRVALMPSIAADIKVAAEESLVNRLEKLSPGEKLSLARRASGRVAEALLHDSDARVINAALQNSRLTESAVLRELSRRTANPQLINALCVHPKWSARTEITIALVRDENTPIDAAARLARVLPRVVVQEIMKKPHLSEVTRARLQDVIAISAKAAE